MTLGLTAGAMHSAPVIGRVVSSAQSFRFYYRDLKQTGAPMGPLERLVFSLVMANPKTQQMNCSVEDRRT